MAASKRSKFNDYIEIALIAVDEFFFTIGNQRDRNPRCTHSAGATNSVEVILRERGEVKVDDMSEALDI